MNKIQMVDLQSQYKNIKSEIDNAVIDVIESGQYINGPAVQQFSSNLAKYMSVIGIHKLLLLLCVYISFLGIHAVAMCNARLRIVGGLLLGYGYYGLCRRNPKGRCSCLSSYRLVINTSSSS